MALDKKRIYPEETEPIYVNADMPASEQDLTSENPDDKALEQTMQNEDFVAGEESDKQPRDMSNEELLSHLENINPIKMSDEDLVGELSNQINTKQNIPQTSTEPRNLEPETVNKIDSQFENLDQTQPEQSPFNRLTASIDENKKQEANRLSEAQQERRRNIAGQQFSRGAALLGGGIASASPDKILDVIDKSEPYVGLPVKEYDEQVANQQNDPSSSMSQVMRDYLKKQGFEISDSYSAADISKVAPFLMNDKKLQTAMEKAILSSQTKKETTHETEAGKGARQGIGIQSKEKIAAENAKLKEKGLEAGDKRHQETLGLKKDYLALRKEQGDQRIGLSGTKAIEGDDIIKKANQRHASTITALDQLNDKAQPLTYNRLNAIQIDLASTLNFMSSQGATDYKAKSDKLENLNTKLAELKSKFGTKLVDLRKEAPEVYREIIEYAKSVQKSVDAIRNQRYKDLSGKISKGIGENTATGSRIKQNYEEPQKQPVSAHGMHHPGDLVTVQGKQYRVGQDGDSLEPIQ